VEGSDFGLTLHLKNIIFMNKYFLLPLLLQMLIGSFCLGQTLSKVDIINQSLRKPTDKKVLVCAHRGDWRNAPENSLQAVKNCIDMGVDIVEIDIQKSKDGHLILLHDETLDRATTGKGYAKDWTLDSIKTLRIRDGLTNPTNQSIPTLEEVLLLAKGKAMLYLDKADKHLPDMLALLDKMKMLDHAVFMLPYTYEQAKSKFGNYLNRVIFIPRIEMSVEDPQAFIEEYVKNFKPVAIQLRLPAEDSPRVDLIPIIQKQKMRVVVSTIWDYVSAYHDDDRAFHEPDAHWGWHVRGGVSIFNTDRPALLLDYLRKKGLHN